MIDAARHSTRIFQLGVIVSFSSSLYQPTVYGEVFPEPKEYCGTPVMLYSEGHLWLTLSSDDWYWYKEFKDCIVVSV
jgi:hypothetical protein